MSCSYNSISRLCQIINGDLSSYHFNMKSYFSPHSFYMLLLSGCSPHSNSHLKQNKSLWKQECRHGYYHSSWYSVAISENKNYPMLESLKQASRAEVHSVQLSSLQSFSRIQLFATPAARQASRSITNFWSLLKLMPVESVMPSSHLILCCPLLLLLPIPPSIRVFSNESTLRMRWPKYWSFSFSVSPSNEHPGLISFRMDWLDLLAVSTLDPTKLEVAKR